MKKTAVMLMAAAAVLMLAACGPAGMMPDDGLPASPAEEAVSAADVPAGSAGGPASASEVSDPSAEEPAVSELSDGVYGEPVEASGGDGEVGEAWNDAHGGTAGDVSAKAYKAYLAAWLDAEQAVDDTMTDDRKAEIIAQIDAGDYTAYPADMLFGGALVTGSPMTYDEFVAADGLY